MSISADVPKTKDFIDIERYTFFFLSHIKSVFVSFFNPQTDKTSSLAKEKYQSRKSS